MGKDKEERRRKMGKVLAGVLDGVQMLKRVEIERKGKGEEIPQKQDRQRRQRKI